MKVLKNLRTFKKSADGCIVTIGVFDGVHIGHRKIIRRVVSRAREKGLKSVVLTFDPHPQKVVNAGSQAKSLISLGHRVRLIGELGVDMLVILNFTPAFSRLSAAEFIKDILVKKVGAREIYIGENFCFGRGGRTNAQLMEKIAKDFDIKVHAVKSVKRLGHVVSSSRIRHLIASGRLVRAERLLGRKVAVFGTVIKGAGIATGLGYPTANINPHHEIVPPSGVYAVTACVGKRCFNGVLNIGRRPTFYGPRDEEPAIEVHIFDFHEGIYGKNIEIFFIKKMRDEKRFNNKRDLIAQIRRDALKARSMS